MRAIDLDSHSNPKRQDCEIEPEYAHLRPRSYVDPKGYRRQFFDQQLWSITEPANSSWGKASSDAVLRYDLIKAAGVDIQYITAGRVSGFSYTDAKVGAAFCRSYNNFLYKNFMKPYPDTFIGVPQLPFQDISEAIVELRRCVHHLGMHTFVMPTNWNGTDMADPAWWNFYEQANELGISGILVHIDSLPPYASWIGKERLKILGPDGSTGRRILSHPFEYSTMIVNLMFGGMLDEFPDLRFAFLETGAEYAIVLKHRLHENLAHVEYLTEMIKHPVDWYFERLYFPVDPFSATNSKPLHYAIEELGADQLFLGSDFPHHDGDLSPFSMVKELSDLSSELKDKILGGNISKLMSGKLY
jgi:aminocarboxymuconate-semialdehyde decarboxylase